MDKDESEIRYLGVEANKLLEFLSKIRQNQREVVLIPNLSYGFVAISPIIPILRKEKYTIYTNKIGSSESHGNSLIIGSQPSLPLESLTDSQPHFAVIDGTRNTGGVRVDNHKYPDSQQGYLNYTIILNDYITSQDAKSYMSLLGVSLEHIKELRNTSEYWTQKKRLEEKLKDAKLNSPYSFKYWNPANLTLALLNHGDGCAKQAKSFNQNTDNASSPTVFFVNSVMPNKNHSLDHRTAWSDHSPAYFDDNRQAGNFQFSFDERGIYLISGLGKTVEQIYAEIHGGNKDGHK